MTNEMLLAHTLGVGGPDLELIMIAGAMAVLGVVFFFQKAVKPVVSIGLIVVAIVAGSIAFAVGGDPEPETQQSRAAEAEGGVSPEGASVTITSPSDGDTVPANEKVEITYEVDPGNLPPDQLGDMHVYVDGELQSMQTTEVLEIELKPGTYMVGVEAAQPNHASFDPMVLDEIELTAER
jgi:hypothetical protein